MACHCGLHEAAAQMNGYSDGWYSATGGARREVESHFRETSQAWATRILGPRAYQAAREGGAQWSQDTMRATVLSVLRSLRAHAQMRDLTADSLHGRDAAPDGAEV